MRHAEFLPNLLGCHILAFERKRGGTRGDVQTRNLLQHGQQLLAYTVGEIFAPFVVAHINEWQNGDRLRIDCTCRSDRRCLSRRRLLPVLIRPLHPPPATEQRDDYQKDSGWN